MAPPEVKTEVKTVKEDKAEKQYRGLSGLRPLLLDQEDNKFDNWKDWKLSFEIYKTAQGLDGEEDHRKNAILLHHMGQDVLYIFKSFNINISQVKHEDLIKRFDDYFRPKKNLCMERYKFFTRRQLVDEEIDKFYTSLTNLSLSCDFSTLRESPVRDIFIVGLKETYIQEKLLEDGEQDLTKIFEKAMSLDLSRKRAGNILKSNNAVADESCFYVGRKQGKKGIVTMPTNT